jgi:quinol monooxygenase YgiN
LARQPGIRHVSVGKTDGICVMSATGFEIRLKGHVICADAADAALIAAHVPVHIALTLAEPGCVSFSVTRTGDPLIWTVDETFADQAAFDAHQTRTRASEWYRLTAHIPRQYVITAG